MKFLRSAKVGSHPSPSSVAVAGFGGTGPIVAAARAVAGDAIDRAAVDTGGFRFAKLLDYRDPRFLPGGAKYLDLPGMLALGAPASALAGGRRQRAGARLRRLPCGRPDGAAHLLRGESSREENAVIEWLLK